MANKKASTISGLTANDSPPNTWIDDEVGGCTFKDERFSKLLGMLSEGIGESVPYAFQDWANTKAAYRFFSNAHGKFGVTHPPSCNLWASGTGGEEAGQETKRHAGVCGAGMAAPLALYTLGRARSILW